MKKDNYLIKKILETRTNSQTHLFSHPSPLDFLFKTLIQTKKLRCPHLSNNPLSGNSLY